MVVETLKDYLNKYKAERNEIALKDDEVAIRELVAEFERETRANFAAKKEKDLATKDSEIIAIEILIKRIETDEEAKKQEMLNAELKENIEDGDALIVNHENNADEPIENVLGDLDLTVL